MEILHLMFLINELKVMNGGGKGREKFGSRLGFLSFSRRYQTLLHRLTDSCNQLDLQRLVMSDSQNCKLLQDRKRWA